MQLVKSLRVVALFFCMPIGGLASELNDLVSRMTKFRFESSDSNVTLKELVNSIDSLAWISRFFQYKDQFPSTLGHNYTQLLTDLDNCKSENGAEVFINKAANELYTNIMESESNTDKKKALQAADPSLNDATITYLIDLYLNKSIISTGLNILKDLSSTIDSLSVWGIKVIDKDCANAKIVLRTEYNLSGVSAVDSSIWFLLTQLGLYKSSFAKFKPIANYISEIIDYKTILRAEVDIEHLFDSTDNPDRWQNWLPLWSNYLIEKSPFNDKQLYYSKVDVEVHKSKVDWGVHESKFDWKVDESKVDWELIGKLLLLEDPNFIAAILDLNLPIEERGTRSYLLLLHDNPAKRLMRLEIKNIGEMYSCFVFSWSVLLYPGNLGHVCKMPKEKLIELTSYLPKLKILKGGFCPKISEQLQISYLCLASLFVKKKESIKLDMNYARRVARMSQTFQLLDVLDKSYVSSNVRGVFFGQPFNDYLFERRDWDGTVGEHFHFVISSVILNNSYDMERVLEDYIGIKTGEAIQSYESSRKYLKSTFDKVPLHLNSYFKLIDEQAKGKNMCSRDRFRIAVNGSLSNNEVSKEDFVYYQVKYIKSLSDYLEDLEFIDLARIHSKVIGNEDPKIKHFEIKQFLHFERFVRKYFPYLVRMDLERGFQRLHAKNSFSIALETVIKENFRAYNYTFVLEGLQKLENELIKYNPEITMGIHLNNIPKMTLLKAAYLALSASPDEAYFVQNISAV